MRTVLCLSFALNVRLGLRLAHCTFPRSENHALDSVGIDSGRSPLRSARTMAASGTMGFGSVRVRNDSLLEELVKEAQNTTATSLRAHNTLARSGRFDTSAESYGPDGRPLVLNRTRDGAGQVRSASIRAEAKTRRLTGDREATRARLRDKFRQDTERIRRADEQRRARLHAEEEEKFTNMYNGFMAREQDLMVRVNEFCRLDDANRQRKAKALCRDWHEQVFDRIQRQIDRQLRGVSSHDIAARRRKLYDQFLSAANSKESGLFRDIIIENEYDPLVAREHTIRYKPYTENDPVKLELNQAAEEKQTLPGEFQEQPELGRQTLKPTMWDKLDATPYGRFNKMMEAKKAEKDTFRSNIAMDHYTFPRVRRLLPQARCDCRWVVMSPPRCLALAQGQEVLRTEFPRGKKSFPDWKPGTTLHDLDTGNFQ